MQGRPLILCCWPGLARLWLRGEWSSLLVAIGFSLLLNLALVSSFVWPALWGPTFPILAWPLVALGWCVSAGLSYRQFRRDLDESPDPRYSETAETLDTLFILAQNEYLKGDWTRAENLLNERLKSHPRDVEARLMLASVLRRVGRFERSIEQLKVLGRFDASLAWEYEIGCERRVAEQQRSLAEQHGDDTRLSQQENESDESADTTADIKSSGTVRLGEASNTTESLSPDSPTADWPVELTQRRAA